MNTTFLFADTGWFHRFIFLSKFMMLYVPQNISCGQKSSRSIKLTQEELAFLVTALVGIWLLPLDNR
jgi:hypothetical protein